MLKMWIFPMVRICKTNKDLTKIFLMFVDCEEFSVSHVGSHHITVNSSFGELSFWTQNRFYAFASEGEFTDKNGKKKIWKHEMPSRYAVKRMAQKIPRNDIFQLENK